MNYKSNSKYCFISTICINMSYLQKDDNKTPLQQITLYKC